LLGDTKTLLAHWDESQAVRENLDRIRRENLFGKASRSRVEDILAIFHQRYLSDEAVTKALVILTKGGFPAATLDRILFFHAASADLLLHDAVTQILLPMHSHGLVNVDVADFEKAVVKWVNEGKTTTKWSEITIRRATQELLAALRDFGVLQGASNTAKVIAAMLCNPEVQVDEVLLAAMEGRHYLAERGFRQRNRVLIEAKKKQSDGKCSVCGFDFKERYRGIEKDHLVAHHVKPNGQRKRALKTTLAEIDLLCPNCHAAVHSEDPPQTANQLRKMLIS